MSLQKTLWRGGRVLSPTSPHATALLTEGDRITWVGEGDDAPAADRTVDLAGALTTPAFVDSHVHLGGTGASLTGLHLAGLGSAAELLDRVAAHALDLPSGAIVLAHGWDETTWGDPSLPLSAEVEKAAAGRLVYLSRTCGHTGIAGPRLLAERPDLAALDGFDASGLLTRGAHRSARAGVAAAVPISQRLDAVRAALEHAASLGIAAVAEHTIPVADDPATEDEFTGLIALGARPDLPAVYGWWGELGAAERARDLGAHGCGGDLSIDGSLGAHTAFLSEPYRDRPAETGARYFTAEQVREHLSACHRTGLPAAFHAIGDAAIQVVLDGLDLVEPLLGLDAIRHARHRIEHAELLNPALTARMVHHGVHASVQPSFDAAWGGSGGMYAARLGIDRALAANPLSRMAGVGVPLAFGSDSPVTPLDPWGGVAAAVGHHNPSLSLTPTAAFSAATRGGWRALGVDDSGALAPGMRADFTVWELTDGRIPELSDLHTPAPMCSMTIAGGHLVYQRS
ncbi:amidohydrolase [Glycomyces buryatensis]|uniref:Amidohydrolase n=1 Tax=Glycomyces buryatensis TaxID=2570927 RepID=A0A4S8PYT7_9ACTN|nr:amidohydrolase family protein [Glycomyces buryatensis]THV33399.1 amidohydrolase [Glycomyces buryatensis]